MDLLRIATAGSVDDGKSTLIGRLLYETGSVPLDQLAQIDAATRRRGDVRTNLAFIADGLRAEREQDITIDVAYKYFRTRRRAFIIADTPGHVQYTRNMATGASTADLALILIDASKGATTQTRRHAFITSLLGIPHLLVVINKMDLVSYGSDAYDRIVADFTAFAGKLTIQDISFIPVSALEGDNVVAASTRMPWHQGGSLLHRLETSRAGVRRNLVDARLPVQHVIRAPGFRGVAGTMASGSLARGAEIVVLPSGMTTRVATIETADGPCDHAYAGSAVVLTTTDEIDVGRGDLLAPKRNLPTVASRVDTYLCWMAADALSVGRTYLLQHTTRHTAARVDRIEYRVNIDTLHREPAENLRLNDIGRVELSVSQPLCFDSYRINSATGSFILIDPQTYATVAAGMIRGEVATAPLAGIQTAGEAHTEINASAVTRVERERRQGHQAAVIWLTGLSGAGKTTIARLVARRLFERGCHVLTFDGDQVRQGLGRDLGFSPEDRAENIRRVGEVAALCFEQGAIVLCAFISPYRRDRAAVRSLMPAGRFIEVFVRADADTCRARDPKRLYAQADAGTLPEFTGVSAPYETPADPEIVLDTTAMGPAMSADTVIAALEHLGIVQPAGRR